MALQGTSDLTLNDRKFSGNAQQRKRTHLLHHGTLLYAFETASLARYLKPPPRQPAYRGGRAHADFVTNLPIAAETLRAMMKRIWQATEAHDRLATGYDGDARRGKICYRRVAPAALTPTPGRQVLTPALCLRTPG